MPLTLFSSLLIAWITTMLIDRRFRRRRADRIGTVGRTARMNYAAVDRFGLHQRLLEARDWSESSAELEVKDVLYGSADGERCFIFTAKTRRSIEVPAARRLARLIESTQDGRAVELVTRESRSASEDVPIYEDLLDAWRKRHPRATAVRAPGASEPEVTPVR